ncbi:MAG: AAA family ATPase [Gammaproteobacteria bacterium]|nr:MAG: AAA family ATPase [Gammaproteobacteria bacterium]
MHFDVYIRETCVIMSGADGVDRTIPLSQEYQDLRKQILEQYTPEPPSKSNDFSFAWKDRFFRGHIFMSRSSWIIHLRGLLFGDLYLDELGFVGKTEDILSIARGRGLTLFVGPSGCGKTTTMHTVAQELERNGIRGSMVTLEDPVEYYYSNERVFQREIGKDVDSVAEGLVEVTRQRPRTILIGEIIDPDTAYAAVLAGLSGHRVLATMHANDIRSAIARMMSLLGKDRFHLFAEAMQGLMSQVLIWPDYANAEEKPIVIYETLKIEDVSRSIFREGFTRLPELGHEFKRQKRQTMVEFGESLVRRNHISAEQFNKALSI